MKLLSLLLALFLTFPVFAQRDWDAIEIKTHPVTDNISYLEGSGGNIGVLHGKDGIMIVDDQFEQLSDKIKVSLEALSAGELKFIVNTHYHGDHVGGNANLSSDGATIVAHEKVRNRLGNTFYSATRGADVKARPESYWPTITFSESIQFHLNGEDVELTYVPNAHTDGDALIYFKTSNVLHTGDAFVRYGYPFIDVDAGGSIDGFIAAQDKILALANANTEIIPGHGGIASIEDVKEIRTMLIETRQAVAAMKADGKSLAECLEANVLAAYHERWTGGFIDSNAFTRVIYNSIP